MFKQEGYALMAVAFDVYNELGNGFLEEVYQECMLLELEKKGMPFISQPELNIIYKGVKLNKFYRPDIYVCDGIIVELKAVKVINEEHMAQLMNYLKATEKPVGYLINFGSHEKLEWKRIIRTEACLTANNH